MSFHNSKGVSKSFKSPFKNQEASSSPVVESDLVQEVEILRRKEAHLDDEILNLTTSGVTETDAETVINLLHKFNDVKDATQIVLGRLATIEGRTVQQLHEQFGLNDKN